MILTCHIVLAVNSTSRSLIVFGVSKNRKGFPGIDGKHDFASRLPTNVSSYRRPLPDDPIAAAIGRFETAFG